MGRAPPAVLIWLAEHLRSDVCRPGHVVEQGTGEQSAADELVVWLRAQSKVIVCDEVDWTLAPAQRTLPSGPTIAPTKVDMG